MFHGGACVQFIGSKMEIKGVTDAFHQKLRDHNLNLYDGTCITSGYKHEYSWDKKVQGITVTAWTKNKVALE